MFSGEFQSAQGKINKDAGLAIFRSEFDVVLGIATAEQCVRATTSMTDLQKATHDFPGELEAVGATRQY